MQPFLGSGSVAWLAFVTINIGITGMSLSRGMAIIGNAPLSSGTQLPDPLSTIDGGAWMHVRIAIPLHQRERSVLQSANHGSVICVGRAHVNVRLPCPPGCCTKAPWQDQKSHKRQVLAVQLRLMETMVPMVPMFDWLICSWTRNTRRWWVCWVMRLALLAAQGTPTLGPPVPSAPSRRSSNPLVQSEALSQRPRMVRGGPSLWPCCGSLVVEDPHGTTILATRWSLFAAMGRLCCACCIPSLQAGLNGGCQWLGARDMSDMLHFLLVLWWCRHISCTIPPESVKSLLFSSGSTRFASTSFPGTNGSSPASLDVILQHDLNCSTFTTHCEESSANTQRSHSACTTGCK